MIRSDQRFLGKKLFTAIFFPWRSSCPKYRSPTQYPKLSYDAKQQCHKPKLPKFFKDTLSPLATNFYELTYPTFYIPRRWSENNKRNCMNFIIKTSKILLFLNLDGLCCIYKFYFCTSGVRWFSALWSGFRKRDLWVLWHHLHHLSVKLLWPYNYLRIIFVVYCC